MHEEVALLSTLVTGSPTADPQAWQSQMMLVFQLLLPATGVLDTRNAWLVFQLLLPATVLHDTCDAWQG